MSNKKIFMSVTASAVIATTLFGAQSAEAASYKVKQGDTLWGISQKHNTSVSQLRTLNNLTSDIIFPNQVLEVGGTANATPNKTASNNKASAPKKQASNSNSSSKGKTYTVKKGDNLSKIAAAHGISLKNLKEWNNLKSDLIFPGQVFQVGGKASANSTPPKQSSSKPKQEVKSSNSGNSNSASKGSTYTVKSGDTLSKIASAHGISLKNLMEWNNLNSTLIYPGNKLVVSKNASSGGSTNTNKGSSGNTSNGSQTNNNNSSSNNSSKSGVYTVKSGDTLSKIATAHGVTVNNLMSWNNLKSTVIYIGDKLVVNAGTADSTPVMKDEPTVTKPITGGLIDVAKSALGVPYVWAGSSLSGFDCSGFIYWAFNQAGTNISRLSTEGYYNRSYMINSPQVGDLVFFEGTYKSGISHMGIYLGSNKFIHAGSSTGVTIADLNSSYWKQHFHSFKRFY